MSKGHKVDITSSQSLFNAFAVVDMDKIKSILFESVDAANFEWQSKYNTLVHEISLN